MKKFMRVAGEVVASTFVIAVLILFLPVWVLMLGFCDLDKWNRLANEAGGLKEDEHA